MSLRASMSVRPSHCSGDMYSGVPAGASSLVDSTRSPPTPTLRTRPKSNSLAPDFVDEDVLRLEVAVDEARARAPSRPRPGWPARRARTPRAASARRAPSAVRPGAAPARTPSPRRPSRRRARRARRPPGRAGRRRPTSASASRIRLSPAATLSARATLMATGCPSEIRSARKTAPKPPCPSVRRTRKTGRSGVGTTNGVVSSGCSAAGGGGPVRRADGRGVAQASAAAGQRIIAGPLLPRTSPL